MFSYNKDEYITPKPLFDELNKEFNFTTDPCTTKDNPLKTAVFYTKEDDGLSKPWVGNVFINPPYGKDIIDWIVAAHSYKHGIVVMLLPARTDTKWFHDYVYDQPNIEIRFIRGRLKFGGASKPNTAPFPSMIVIFRGNKKIC